MALFPPLSVLVVVAGEVDPTFQALILVVFAAQKQTAATANCFVDSTLSFLLHSLSIICR